MKNFKYKELSPCIFVFDNVINNADQLIKLANKKNNSWFDASLTADSVINKEIRNTKTIDISPSFANETEWFSLAKVLWQYGDYYGRINGAPFSKMEDPQFLKYIPNEGKYSPHTDSSREIPRIFSSVLYLNNVDEGGETYFNKFDLSVKPRAGRLLMFPSNFAYVHEAKIPKSNEKNVIVTWFTP
jgi:hypothetical protein